MKKSKILITMIALLTFMTIPVHAKGWKQDSKGWWYEYTNGTYASNRWEKIDGKWYAFDKQGYMRTGWFQENGKWYYLDASGEMKTGWVQDNGKKYYMDKVSGEMKTGLLEIGKGNWYYFGVNGDMKRGCQIKGTNGNWYQFEEDGRYVLDNINGEFAQSNIAIHYIIFAPEFIKFELTDGILTVSSIRSGEFSYPISKDCVWKETIEQKRISYKYIKDLIDYEIERYKNLEDSERRNFEWSPLTFFIDIVDDVVVSVGYMAP